jgi:hypothetical protein
LAKILSQTLLNASRKTTRHGAGQRFSLTIGKINCKILRMKVSGFLFFTSNQMVATVMALNQ